MKRYLIIVLQSEFDTFNNIYSKTIKYLMSPNYISLRGIMKKTKQILATIISLIMLTFFVGSAQAQVCTGSYHIDDINTSGDIAYLSGCTEITGDLIISNTSLTSLSGLENLTSVGGSLGIFLNNVLTSLSGLEKLTSVGSNIEILSNAVLTSLSGLENLTSVGGFLEIFGNNALTSLSGLGNLTSVGEYLEIGNNVSLTNLCALYNVHLAGYMVIQYNSVLSMDTAYALETQLRSNGFTGTADIRSNSGTVNIFCGIDSDGDSFLDTEDNCPNTANPNQEDADNDTIGDACDADTIYGNITGDVQEGVSIDISVYTCGVGELITTITTNAEGYYAFGGLGNDTYGIYPQHANYIFSRSAIVLDIPQAEIRSYDFTAIED
jgi:hypothetical protein